MTRVVLLAEARIDVLDAFHWYEQERPGLGKVFRASLHRTIQRLQQAPLGAPVVYRDLRRALVDRFPYGIFYRAEPGVIVGVIHGHRRPSAWKRRA